MINIEIKTFKALVPVSEYTKYHALQSGDILRIDSSDWKILVIVPENKVILLAHTSVDNTLVLKFDEVPSTYIITECFLKSDLKHIAGVEQLSIF